MNPRRFYTLHVTLLSENKRNKQHINTKHVDGDLVRCVITIYILCSDAAPFGAKSTACLLVFDALYFPLGDEKTHDLVNANLIDL